MVEGNGQAQPSEVGEWLRPSEGGKAGSLMDKRDHRHQSYSNPPPHVH